MENMKDYKKIVKYNQPSKHIVDNWKELALKLRSFGISPQEACDIIYNNKRALLNRWNEKYPVTRFERIRNRKIGNIQGNLNPFIAMRKKNED